MIRLHSDSDHQDSGAKAQGLQRLTLKGFRVPPWLSVTAHADIDDDELRRAAGNLGPGPYAVRSSSTVEDGATHSFAGLFDSRLNVPIDALASAVRTIRDSGAADRVVAYAQATGATVEPGQIPVIIQQMVTATAAGVGVSQHPNTGADVCVIQVAPGLGDAVVNGQADCDTVVATSALDWTVERAESRTSDVLSHEQLGELVAGIKRLGVSQPVDVEFAFDGDNLWWLQSRPMASENLDSPEELPVTVWDNNNLVDNYPGLSSPLTISFVQRIYGLGNRQLARTLGLPESTINAHVAAFDEMVGGVRGRLYYNLSNIRGLLGLLPMSDRLISAYDNAIGSQSDPVEPSGVQVGALLRTIRGVSGALYTLQANLERTQSSVADALRTIDNTDLEACSADQLLNILDGMERDIAGDWRAPPLNGFVAMILLALLGRLSTRWNLDGSVRNAVLAGGAPTTSASVVHSIQALAATVRADPALLNLFDEYSDDALINVISGPLAAAVTRHLKQYGERTVGGELKLETPTTVERPELLFQAIRSHLGDPTAQTATLPDLKAVLSTAFSGHPVRRRLYSTLARRTRTALRWREDFRFLRTQLFHQTRRVYRALGNRLHEAGTLNEPLDVFWLTVEEVAQAARGELTSDTARERIDQRTRRYATYATETLPERVQFAGDSHHFVPPIAEYQTDLERIQGVGCCPGVVRGIARVVRDPCELSDLHGGILVAPSTDVGWVQYFPTASAIVTERGGLLSHVAIVTREMRIPCVIGAKQATHSIRTGDTIQIDGSTGEIVVLTAAPLEY